MKNQNKTTRFVLRLHGVQLKRVGCEPSALQCRNLWRRGRPDCLSSKKMSKSRRFQPYPSTTIDKTINTVDRCVGRNVERELCERQEKVTLLLFLPSFLLVIIGNNKSIVL
jgi:hypothetical protein